MIYFCHVLSERVKVKECIGRICFYPPTHMIWPTCSVTLVVEGHDWRRAVLP